MAVKQETPPSFMGSIQSEVSAEASPMLQFLMDHAKLIALVVVLFIAAILGYWAYSSNQEKAEAEQRLQFGRLLEGKTGAARIAILEQYIGTAPESMKPAAWFALAEVAEEEKDYAAVYKAWEAIGKMDSALHATAILAMAQALVEQGKNTEALELLDSISGKVDKSDVVNVNRFIAFLAEEQGRYDRAIAAAEAILAHPSTADNSFWTQKIAMLQKMAAAAQ